MGIGALDPYGYLRHPDDKHKLIINEETAPVVRRMFEMCAAGIGARSIATALNNEGILSPKEYTRFRKHNPERDGEFERRHFWTRTYVQFMLKNEIYVGSMVQGRQYTPSYRSKKREPSVMMMSFGSYFRKSTTGMRPTTTTTYAIAASMAVVVIFFVLLFIYIFSLP